MSKPDKQAQEIAALRKEVEELKAAVAPKPKSEFKEETDAEHFDRMHQMRERQANSWTPPNAIRDMVNAEPKGFMAGVLRDNRAPTGRPGMIPDSQQPSNARPAAGGGSGWVAPTPLSNPPGVAQADRLMDEQDRRDRAELARKLGGKG
jgi:hypothetical protein